MKSAAHSAGVSPPKEEIEWEMRPGGMFVQRREVDDDDDSSNGPMIKISVAYASSQHEVFLPAQSTFGESLLLFSHCCSILAMSVNMKH